MSGRFIVFEGGEGAGKTTQIRALYTWLQNDLSVQQLLEKKLIADILMTREPGGSEFGKAIRHLLLDYVPPSDSAAIAPSTELLLYAADRAQHVEEYLQHHLDRGALILCDRYTDSTVAYQGYGRNLDLSLIHTLNQIATNGLQPDLTLWLDIDVEAGLSRTRERGQADRMEKNDLAFHERVRQGFQALANEHSHRIVRIDAHQDMAAVSRNICAVVQHKIAEWYGQTIE
ncbi:MAG: dTMP kinase [Leptolyngbyaceae bacterium]|nr:dTMP kinase [Leptolyngbyaceae bacterium]